MPHGSTVTDRASRRPAMPAWKALLESIFSLGLVLGAIAIGLRALDAVPGALTGNPRGVRHVDSIDALQRETGLKAPLPPYFPDTLRWPPAAIRVFGRGAATLMFVRRDSGSPWLLIGLARGQNEGLPARLLEEGLTLQSSPVAVAGQPATLRRLRTSDGLLWQELTWRSGAQVFVMRYRGSLEQLETMASSLQGQQQ